MIDNTMIKVLSNVYLESNAEWDFEKNVRSYVLPKNLSEKELKLLTAGHYEINDIIKYDHDSAIKSLKALANHDGLEKVVFNLFLKAVGEGFHRGLQPIISFLNAKNMPEHIHMPVEDVGLQYEEGKRPCRVCGLRNEKWSNNGLDRYYMYIGLCHIATSFEMLSDLKEVQGFASVKATKADISVFERLIKSIDRVDGESPTELLSRISKEKILAKSNNVSRTWLIRVLAELGIIKNTFDSDYGLLNKFIVYEQRLAWELVLHKQAPSHRTEINFPLSALARNDSINFPLVEKMLATAAR